VTGDVPGSAPEQRILNPVEIGLAGVTKTGQPEGGGRSLAFRAPLVVRGPGKFVANPGVGEQPAIPTVRQW
jgi:hypothetical protein